MADEELCTVEDVFRYAVPRGALTFPAREVSSVDTSTGILEIVGHGLELDDPVEVRAFAGGTLPAELSPTEVFYARPVTDSDSLLQLAASPGGPAITYASEGESWGVVASVRGTVRAQIRAVTQWIFRRIPAHSTPLEPDGNGRYPETVRQMAAILAAEATLTVLCLRNDLIAAAADRMREEARLLLSGLPMRDTKVTATPTNLARGASPGSSIGRWGSSDPKVVP